MQVPDTIHYGIYFAFLLEGGGGKEKVSSALQENETKLGYARANETINLGRTARPSSASEDPAILWLRYIRIFDGNLTEFRKKVRRNFTKMVHPPKEGRRLVNR